MRKSAKWLPRGVSALVIIAALSAWELASHIYGAVLLPPPLAVMRSFLDDVVSTAFLYNVWVTFQEVAIGLVIATAIGLIGGVVTASVRLFEQAVTPLVVAFQAVPKVAFAPLLLVWFGYGTQSKVVLVVLVTFFPVFINVVAGFKNVDADKILLMRTLRASWMQTFYKMRLPLALPYVFAGLEISVVLAVIAAVIGEFTGASEGLGALILQRQARLDIAGVFSAVAYLSLMGVMLHYATVLAARKYSGWADQRSLVAA
jgi:NitT/TauT family transport system permease protein